MVLVLMFLFSSHHLFSSNRKGAIIGGVLYQGTFDDRLKDKYIFADVSFGIYWDAANSRYGTNYGSDNKLFAISPERWDSLTGNIPSPLSWAEEIKINPCSKANCPHTIDEVDFPGKANIHSFGTDNEHNIYLTGPLGLHRLVSPSLCQQTPAPTSNLSPAPTAETLLISTVPFRETELFSSTSGFLEVTLRVIPAIFRTTQFEIQTRSYNGHFPGPTISILPGSELRVTLVNQLANILGNANQSIMKGHPLADIIANYTNLHFHGFHTSPESENVIDDLLAPGL